MKAGGSFARINLPTAISTTSYDDANRQIAFGSQTLAYDNNGNLTSDGVNTYTWNARDELVSLSGPGLTASFQYDAWGRRISKTINGASVSFVYDGENIVQEKVDSIVSANLLNGGIDEILTRSDSSGTSSFIKDGLRSTVALTNSTGAIQTEHTYEPFGKTTTSGATSGNASKYTGREDDGTGLYYYRARYFSPSLQRFISEDPIEFGGGDPNLYGYAGNDPINFSDPSGLEKESVWDLIGYVASGEYEDHIWECLSKMGNCEPGPIERYTGGGGIPHARAGFGSAIGGIGRAVGKGAKAFRRWTRIHTAVGRLPKFRGRAPCWAEGKLTGAGFKNDPAKPNIWYHPDGSFVRIDPPHGGPNGFPSDQYQHYHKYWRDRADNKWDLDDCGYINSDPGRTHIIGKRR